MIHDTREAPDALIYVRSGDEKVIRNPFEVDEELEVVRSARTPFRFL